ncbi:MAG: hypothetical protein KY476_04735 [Planctomycetes bacterium]|nr:hypothetical protein [Planctomycetota bacterium]
MVEFRGWQRELELLRQELSAPLQRSTRGEGRELDLERFLRDRRNAG